MKLASLILFSSAISKLRIPYSEDPIDIITELGNSYDVFPQTKPRMMLMSGESTTIGDRMGMIYIDNQFGYDYLSYLCVGGRITVQDGNLDGKSNPFIEAMTDWHEVIWDISAFVEHHGGVIYAIPKQENP